jgi:hypothetical protein
MKRPRDLVEVLSMVGSSSKKLHHVRVVAVVVGAAARLFHERHETFLQFSLH